MVRKIFEDVHKNKSIEYLNSLFLFDDPNLSYEILSLYARSLAHEKFNLFVKD